MDLHEEKWILMIAEEQNITRAAEKLFVSPSALTQMVNKIEHDLGTKLFVSTDFTVLLPEWKSQHGLCDVGQ